MDRRNGMGSGLRDNLGVVRIPRDTDQDIGAAEVRQHRQHACDPVQVSRIAIIDCRLSADSTVHGITKGRVLQGAVTRRRASETLFKLAAKKAVEALRLDCLGPVNRRNERLGAEEIGTHRKKN